MFLLTEAPCWNSRREEDYYFYSPHAIFLCHEIKDGGYNNTNIKQAFVHPKYACTAGDNFFFLALCTIVFLLLCVSRVINYWNKKTSGKCHSTSGKCHFLAPCTIVFFFLLCVCRVINYWNKKPQANVTQPKPMIPWLSEIGSMETDQNLATARYRIKGVNIIKPRKISI